MQYPVFLEPNEIDHFLVMTSKRLVEKKKKKGYIVILCVFYKCILSLCWSSLVFYVLRYVFVLWIDLRAFEISLSKWKVAGYV